MTVIKTDAFEKKQFLDQLKKWKEDHDVIALHVPAELGEILESLVYQLKTYDEMLQLIHSICQSQSAVLRYEELSQMKLNTITQIADLWYDSKTGEIE